MTILDLLIKRVSENYPDKSRLEIIHTVWNYVKTYNPIFDFVVSEEIIELTDSLGALEYSIFEDNPFFHYTGVDDFLDNLTIQDQYEKEQLKLLLS